MRYKITIILSILLIIVLLNNYIMITKVNAEELKNVHRLGSIYIYKEDVGYVECSYETWRIIGEKIRINIFMSDGGYFVEGYDGNKAWMIDEEDGFRILERGRHSNRIISELAPIECSGPSIYTKGFGTLEGEVVLFEPELDGKRCYKIKVEEKEKNAYAFLYYDKETELLTKRELFVNEKRKMFRTIPYWIENDGIKIQGKYLEYGDDNAIDYYIIIDYFEINLPEDDIERLFETPSEAEAQLIIDAGCGKLGVEPNELKVDK